MKNQQKVEEKPHQELDKAVDLYYKPQAFTNKNARVEYLFELYNQYAAPYIQRKKQLRRNRKNNNKFVY